MTQIDTAVPKKDTEMFVRTCFRASTSNQDTDCAALNRHTLPRRVSSLFSTGAKLTFQDCSASSASSVSAVAMCSSTWWL